VVVVVGLREGKSNDERDDEKDDIEPYESEVSDELNENPELEIIEDRELDRERVTARTAGEARREDEGVGTVGNWSSKGAIQVAEDEDKTFLDE
jgi:hypothetical protein